MPVPGVAEVNLIDPNVPPALLPLGRTSGRPFRDHMNLIGTPRATLEGQRSLIGVFSRKASYREEGSNVEDSHRAFGPPLVGRLALSSQG